MNTNIVAALSEMQVACLRLVAELKKTEQIAGELGIAPSTVNTHIERAIARLGVPNRREAARLVVAHDAAQVRPNASVAGMDSADAQPQRVATSHDGATGASVAPAVPLPPPPTCPETQPTEELPLAAAVVAAQSPSASTTAMGGRRNDLTIPQRLGLAVLALVLLCIGIAGLGAAIKQLSQWRASLATHR